MNRRPALHLTLLHLERLPGISTPFSVPAKPGVNLISGPNESGKSSVARTVFQLLWPETPVSRPLTVRAEFVDTGGKLQAQRLDDGPVSWTRHGESVPAPSVPGDHLAGCYRLGLLDLNRTVATDGLDHDLALEIRKQMAGGFDLGQVGELFPEGDHLVRRRRKAAALAEQEFQKHQVSQRRLATEERSLVELESEKERAELAVRYHAQLVAAVEHKALAARGTELESRLAALPDHLDQVQPGDAENLAELLKRRQENTQRAADLSRKLANNAARIAELTVGDNLAELANLVREMETRQSRAGESARALAATEARASNAKQDLDPELLVAGIPAGSERAYDQLIRTHRRQVSLAVELDVLSRLLEREILSDSGPEATAPDPAALTTLTSGQLQPATRAMLISALITLGLAAVLLAIGSAQPTESALGNRIFGAVLVLATWGAGSLGTWLRRRRNRRRVRRELAERNRRAGQPLPSGWTTADAASALLEQAGRHGAATAANQTRTAIRRELQERQEHTMAAVRETQQQRHEILRELGRDEDRETVELLHELDRLTRCRAAEEALLSAQAADEHDQSRLNDILNEGQTRLAGMGLVVAATLPAIQAGLDQLRERRSEARGLATVQAAAEQSLHQVESELSDIAASHESLCRRLSLESSAADNLEQVTTRVAALPAYQELKNELANTRRDQKRIAAQLLGGDDLPSAAEILALPLATIQAQVVAQLELATTLPSLEKSIVQIREHIKLVSAGSVLEQARAEAAEKAADLQEALDQQRDNLLGRLLVANVARRHEANTQPPVLAAVNEHLSHFTGGRYRLLVVGDSPSRFVALDNTDQRLELAELSDGTRAQLLLAARLAFLGSAESGLQAPLFLDEALTASDPVRFAAIAGALGQLAAATGRQIFYLTSNPSDCAAWQLALKDKGLAPAHVIDLAIQRRLGAAASATSLAPAVGPIIPMPGTLTVAEYGALITVPAMRPWAHENTVHLFHLWTDDLKLLYRVLVAGPSTLGQWRRLGGNLVRAGIVSADEAVHIDARGQVYGAFLENWRHGRGRPLSRADLVASEILTARMIGPAGELLAKTGPDGAAFMAAIQGGGIRGLRAATKEALQVYLERQGHLDSSKIWPAEEIVAQVLDTAAVLKPTEVRQLVLKFHRIAALSQA